MKHYLTKTILALATLLCSMNCWAVAVTINGINYELYTNGGNFCIINRSKVSGDVVIPESIEYEGQSYEVQRIGAEAFYGCSNMTSIQIPKTITSVNPWAFYGCSNLKKVYITDLKAWLAIDFGSFVASPFQDDTRLYLNDKEVTTLTIPDGTTVIKPEVFHGCKSITKVILPNSVKEIGEYAFCNCNNLQSINIPDAVTTIGQAAFMIVFRAL